MRPLLALALPLLLSAACDEVFVSYGEDSFYGDLHEAQCDLAVRCDLEREAAFADPGECESVMSYFLEEGGFPSERPGCVYDPDLAAACAEAYQEATCADLRDVYHTDDVTLLCGSVYGEDCAVGYRYHSLF